MGGRLCLFGEHSDWAGQYRKTDKTIKTGKCLITGTDQGLYASVHAAETGFHISQVLPDGSLGQLFSYEFAELAKIATSNIFDSYAAGTASLILNRYPNLGLKVNIYKRDLPLKKGLSSSAATCVLITRAFNKVHQLNLSIEEEMEFAYLGEQLTGSQCGRMDQGCAYGKEPKILTFDGEKMSANSVNPGGNFHLLIVDLQAEKNTKRILKDLNSSFRNGNLELREALGQDNHRITQKACDIIEKGNAKLLGDLMTEAQILFDEKIATASPEELVAPRLHEILKYSSVKNLTWGGKGVGSQGDGTAQLVCKGSDEREHLTTTLEKKMGVLCYPLTLH